MPQIPPSRLFKRFLPLWLLAFLPCLSLQGGELVFDGTVSYTIEGNTVEIFVERIFNRSLINESGTLRVELWASEAPSDGQSITGHRLAMAELGQTIPPGFSLESISGTVSYEPPPTGMWVYSLVLAERSDVSFTWSLCDVVEFEGRQRVGVSTLSFGGPFAWQVGEGIAVVEFGKLQRINNTGTSGPLKLDFYVINDPYAGGSFTGELLATYDLGLLSGVASLENQRLTAAYTEPPIGTHRTLFLISEQINGTWHPVQWANFADTPFPTGLPLWSDATRYHTGWQWSPWFGYSYIGFDPWAYHLDFGWFYMQSSNRDDLWMWNPDLGWLWTYAGAFPFVLQTSDDWPWIDLRN